MTIKSGLLALSGLGLVTLVMLVSSEDEAYRWVEHSTASAVLMVLCAVIGMIAATSGRFEVALVAGIIALIVAALQFIGLSDGGVIGGNGSTFALFLAFGIGYLGLGLAARVPVDAT